MNEIKRNFLFFCGLILLQFYTSSCNGEQEEVIHSADLPAVELKLLHTITDSDDLLMQHIRDIKSDSQNRLYLLDQSASSIHVIDSEGGYITTIGREGAGPGEFRSLMRIFIDANDHLYTFDLGNNRNMIFTEQNDTWEVEDIISFEGTRFGIQTAGRDGELVLRQSPAQLPEPGVYWYIHELVAGDVESGLKENQKITFRDMGNLVRSDGIMIGIPYGRTTVLSDDPEGNIYMVWNEQFILKTYNPHLQLIDSMSAPIPNQPISEEERNTRLERAVTAGSQFRSLATQHMPASKPVIRAMHIDPDKNIWLQTYDSPEYIVLHSDGEPIGSFDLEKGFELSDVSRDRISASRAGEKGYEIKVYGIDL